MKTIICHSIKRSSLPLLAIVAAHLLQPIQAAEPKHASTQAILNRSEIPAMLNSAVKPVSFAVAQTGTLTGALARTGRRIDPVVGSWRRDKEDFILEANGIVNSTSRTGRWTRKNPGATPATYVLTWDGKPWIDTYQLNPGNTALTGRNKTGKRLSATRLGPPMPDGHADSIMADADGFRVWTDAATGRSFRGRVFDKKFDGSKALIVRDGNIQSVWLDAALLTEPDQFYIRHWVRASDQVKAALTAHGYPGWKRVLATIQAGPEPLLAEVTGDLPGYHREIADLPVPPFKLVVASGETLSLEFASGTNYAVEATAGGRFVCRQEDMKKEGL